MTVTYWREHSNPELSSESALATFNPIIKLAPPPPGSFRRKIDGESDCLGMDERERECVRERKRDFSPTVAPYHNPDRSNPEPFRRGKSCGPEFAFADFVFIGERTCSRL